MSRRTRTIWWVWCPATGMVRLTEGEHLGEGEAADEAFGTRGLPGDLVAARANARTAEPPAEGWAWVSPPRRDSPGGSDLPTYGRGGRGARVAGRRRRRAGRTPVVVGPTFTGGF